MLINFAYNPQLINKPPVFPYPLHQIMWRRLNGGFINTRTSLEKLSQLITSGYAYTVCHARYRHKNNFIQGQILSLDFDKNGSFPQLLSDDFISTYAALIYSTPSSTESAPRSRVIFALPEPVKSAKLFSLMSQALVQKYNQADNQCKDPARLFYGNKGAKFIMRSNVLPLEVIGKLAMELEASQDDQEQRVFVTNISSTTLNDNLQSQLSRIVTAASGDKHRTRLAVGRLVGGWVASGYLPYGDAATALVDAALANTTAPTLARADVISGLDHGLLSPITIKPVTLADWGIDLNLE